MLVVMSLLLLGSVKKNSPTVDEPVLMTLGLSYWWTGDTRLNYTHPPLAHVLSTIPVVLTYPNADLTQYRGWQTATYLPVAVQYMKSDYAKVRNQLLASRKVVVLATLLLGIYIYIWCLQVYGVRTALGSLFLYAFNPIVLANGSLATSDIMIALMLTGTLGEFHFYLQTKRLFRLLTVSSFLSLALLTKYNAVLILPVMLLFSGYYALRKLGRFEDQSGKKRALRLTIESTFTIVLILVCLNGIYRFQETGLNVDQVLAHQEPKEPLIGSTGGRLLEEETPLSILPGGLRIPVPYSYIFGIASQRRKNQIGHRSYFMGEIREHGWSYYFPVMLAIKNPLGMILLLGLALLLFVKQPRAPSRATFLICAAFAFYLSVYVTANINAGVRYALPLVVLMTILAARAGDVAWKKAKGRYGKVFLALTFVSIFIAAVASYPHYLGSFNLLVGGERGGHRISIVGEDWGQDVAAFAANLDRNGAPNLYYDRYTSTQKLELQHHGVEFVDYKCGQKIETPAWVAMHAMEILRMDDPERCYPFVKDRQPDEKINHHIWIYKLESGS
jgi:4-amino-4-deoxy-L-arabinose transferase-like glycosyltransferase